MAVKTARRKEPLSPRRRERPGEPVQFGVGVVVVHGGADKIGQPAGPQVELRVRGLRDARVDAVRREMPLNIRGRDSVHGEGDDPAAAHAPQHLQLEPDLLVADIL